MAARLSPAVMGLAPASASRFTVPAVRMLINDLVERFARLDED